MEELEIGNALYQTRLTSKFRNRKLWKPHNERMVVAVIPGNIQKLMVEEGDAVKMGTPMLILEAMKMRNQVRSPVPGVVKKIHIKVGEMVPKGHLLVEIK